MATVLEFNIRVYNIYDQHNKISFMAKFYYLESEAHTLEIHEKQHGKLHQIDGGSSKI